MADIKARPCKRSRAWHREQWRRHLTAQAESGLTISGYCIAHGLKRETFHRWRRRFKGEAQGSNGAGHAPATPSKAAFAEVVVAPAQQPGNVSGIEVVLRGERRVRVGAGFDEATLLRLVAVLESVPC